MNPKERGEFDINNIKETENGEEEKDPKMNEWNIDLIDKSCFI